MFGGDPRGAPRSLPPVHPECPPRRHLLLGAAGWLAGAAAPAGAQAQTQAQAATWLAGPEGSALTLDDALRQARDGDTVELLPGDYRGGLVLEQRHITLRGAPGGKLPLIKGDGRAGAARA